MMKRVIVTGPTGAIGIALIQELIAHHVEVVAVCHRDSKRMANIPKSHLVTVVECDLNEINTLPERLHGSVDAFYHLGWDGTFGNSRNSVQGQLQNVQYTLDAVEAAARIGCKKFIGAGSQAEYGRVDGISLNADTPVFPENGYGIAKLCAGQMSRLLCEQRGIEHVWVRILSIYGAYDGENTMIMTTIRSLLDGEVPQLTPGEQQWDYLYAKDAGCALRLLGESGKHGQVYCIGSGQTKTLRAYVEILRDAIDCNARLGFGERDYAPNQVMYLCADISDLRRDTGFEPHYSFENGIKETIEWYKEYRR